jgi:hypothetical protein
MGALFSLLYFSTAYPRSTEVPTPRITQDDAIRIADTDMKQKLSDYKGITGIIDTSWSRYVPIDEFEQNNLELPLVYVHPNGSLILVSETGYEIRGLCEGNSRFAYCGYLPDYSFDYGSRLVYGVEVTIDSDEALAMYMIDATSGKIVDSTFLRHEWIRAHT